jgi:CHAT domain-containing protein
MEPDLLLSNLHNLTYYHEKLGKLDSALHYARLGIDKVSLNPDSIKDIRYLTNAAQYLVFRKRVLDIYERNLELESKEENLELLLEECISVIGSISQLITKPNTNEEKNRIFKSAKSVFDATIARGYEINTDSRQNIHLEMADIIEQYKSLILNKSLSEQQIINQAGVSPLQQSQINTIRKEIDSINYNIYSKYNIYEDDSISVIRQRVFELYDSLEQIRHQVTQDNAIYSQLLYEHQAIDEELVSYLLDNGFDNIIQYYHTDSSLYIINLNKKQHEFVKMPFTTDYLQSLESYTMLFQRFDSLINQKEAFQNNTEQLYIHGKQIFDLLFASLGDNIGRRILIIPDGPLSQIPFAALNRYIPQHFSNYLDAGFLINDHEISINYSLNLQKQMMDGANKSKNENNILSLTPKYEATTESGKASKNQQSFSNLPYAEAEGSFLLSLFRGKHMKGPEIKKNDVLAELDHYPLVHIGAHAVINDRHPNQSYIALGDDEGAETQKLFLYELAYTPMSIRLLTLNSCYSGQGVFQAGHGIINFTKGFAMAGTKSILASRWAVEDKSGFEFISRFFSDIKSHRSNDNPLHEIQLQRLKTNDPFYSHPYFWAGYYLIGEPDIHLMNPIPYPYIGLLILGILITGFLWKKRNPVKRE